MTALPRLVLIATTLVSLSTASHAASTSADGFGSCAKGPCIRHAGTHTKAVVLRPRN